MTTSVTIKNHGPKAIVLATDSERVDLGEGACTDVLLYPGRVFTLLEAPDSIEPLPEPLPVFNSTEANVPVELKSSDGFVLGGYLFDPATQVSVPASADFLEANSSVLEQVVTGADAAADLAGSERGLPTYKYRSAPEPVMSGAGEAKAPALYPYGYGTVSSVDVAESGAPEVAFNPPDDGLNVVRAADFTDNTPAVINVDVAPIAVDVVDTPARVEQEVSTPESGYTDGGSTSSSSGGNE